MWAKRAASQYCSLILLWFFSPIVDSPRGLKHPGVLNKVRKNLDG
jgi:hypothetical protein